MYMQATTATAPRFIPANAIGPGTGNTRHDATRRAYAMAGRYLASRALESFILASAPEHHATPDAPSTLPELIAAAKRSGSLPVWDGGSDATMYSRPEVNHAFRAWHDALHIAHGAAFDVSGELALSREHVRQARAAGLSAEDVRALWLDLWGQAVYAERHAGAFPEDQSAFIAACFRYGVRLASRMTF
jgi:hypothetical protein